MEMIRGKVLTQAGRLRKSGAVLLLSSKIPKVRQAHFLRVPIDSKGRFKAKVFTDREYSLWSFFKDREGRIFSSRLQEKIRGGMHTLLREVHQRKSKRLRLLGLPAWGKPKELRLLWKLGSGFEIQREVDKTGDVEIPDFLPFKNGAASFVLKEKGGTELFPGKAYSGGFKGENATYLFSCPKPVRRHFLIVDGRPGKVRDGLSPVEGARLFFHMDEGHWLRGPRSDQDGRVSLKVPKLGGLYTFLFFSVSKKGFGRGHARIGAGQVCVGGKEVKEPQDPLLLPLVEEKGRAAQFFGIHGKGLPGVRLMAKPVVLVTGERGKDNTTMKDRCILGKSDPEGSCRLPGVSSRVSYLQYSFILPSSAWDEVLPKGFSYHLPRGPFRSEFRSYPGSANKVFGLDLSQFHLLPYQVERADGSPLPFAKLQFLADSRHIPLQFQADRRGRGSLLLGNMEGTLIAYGPDDEYYLQEIHTSSQRGGDVLAPKTLRLTPVTTFVSGLVVDAKERPLSGVEISIRSSMRGPLPGARGQLKLNQHFLKGRTDSKGRFRIPYLPHSSLQFVLEFHLGDRSTRLSVDHPMDDVLVKL
jgi:hypothetical protein